MAGHLNQWSVRIFPRTVRLDKMNCLIASGELRSRLGAVRLRTEAHSLWRRIPIELGGVAAKYRKNQPDLASLLLSANASRRFVEPEKRSCGRSKGTTTRDINAYASPRHSNRKKPAGGNLKSKWDCWSIRLIISGSDHARSVEILAKCFVFEMSGR